MLQKSIVPWLVANFGVIYPTKITADIVYQMVRALVKGERSDALVDEYPETFDMIADAAKYFAGPVSASSAAFCRK